MTLHWVRVSISLRLIVAHCTISASASRTCGNQFFRIPGLHPHEVDVEPRVTEDTGFEAVVGIAKIGDDYFECRH